MGKQPSAMLGAALLILAGLGLWIWSRSPEREVPTPAPEAISAELHSRALLRIDVVRTNADEDDETRWLEAELRYLLTRGQVALARPQGPHDPEAGEALFTLKVTATDPAAPLTLALVSPSGIEERSLTVPPAATRLERMAAVAAVLPSLLPRGDTGVELSAFLGTTSAEAYESLALSEMTAGKGELRQSQIASRDTPIDRLEVLTREYPDFARAWAELALLYLRIDGRDTASLTAIAERAAQRALALDTRLADAHAVVGIARQRRGEWLPADTSLAEALALDPAAPAALEAFSCLLVDVGRVRYAKLIAEQAVAVAPDSEQAAECLGYARLALGEAPLPEMPLSNEMTANRARRPRALMALLSARVEEARDLLSPAGQTADGFNVWFAEIARAVNEPGERPAALQAITRAASDGALDPATEILYGVALRQPDFVFNRLQRLKGQREAMPTRILWVKDAAFLKEHARFAAMTRVLGLDAYWKERELPDFCKEAPQAACP